jgi:hypothetical protein
MEPPLSRSSSARVAGSFNLGFWEYLVNKIPDKDKFDEIAGKHKAFGARYRWEEGKGVVSNLHEDPNTGKVTTSEGKALYETDEYWSDIDKKLIGAIKEDYKG